MTRSVLIEGLYIGNFTPGTSPINVTYDHTKGDKAAKCLLLKHVYANPIDWKSFPHTSLRIWIAV